MQNAEYVAHQAENFDSNEPDSLFGICQAAGEDLRISPFLLRIGLLALLFFGPWYAIGAYAGLGALVGASRLLFPKPQGEAAEASPLKRPLEITQDERVPEAIAA